MIDCASCSQHMFVSGLVFRTTSVGELFQVLCRSIVSARRLFGNTENRYDCLRITETTFKATILSTAQSMRMRRVFVSTKRIRYLPVLPGWVAGTIRQVASDSFSAPRNLQAWHLS